MIKAVLFDMIGTTIKAGDKDIVEHSLMNIFGRYGIVPDDQILKNHRGKNKLDMIRAILTEYRKPIDDAHEILRLFNDHILSAIPSFSEMPGVPEVFQFLKTRKIKIGIGTGLSVELCVAIKEHLGWRRYPIDYQGVSSTIGKSRPDPAMIFDMMNTLNIIDPHTVLKVGDTVADIHEGKNAGTRTAVILSGTQDPKILVAAAPDFVLISLAALTSLNIFDH